MKIPSRKSTRTPHRPWFSLALLFLTISFLCQPEAVFAAATAGLSLWAEVVLPSLLPFFILSELLIGIGAAAQLGQKLSPLMRPLFGQPGPASFAVVMGFCSGFPTGAAITASLYKQQLLEKREAERLVAFTNNAGPLYIVVAVATGLLHNPQSGILLALSHYGLNLVLGLLLGLKGRHQRSAAPPPYHTAAAAEPLAQIIKVAAQRAATNIILIGCYMTFFSVVSAMLAPPSLAQQAPLLYAALCGVWEMSLGVNAAANSGLALNAILPFVAAQLAFGGFSVQAQVVAMLADTDLSPKLYLLSRPLHALAAALLTTALLQWLPLPAVQMAPLPAASLLPLAVAQVAAAILLWLILCALAAILHPKKNI